MPMKALSFGLVGVVNAAVDYAVFFIALGALGASVWATQTAASVTRRVQLSQRQNLSDHPGQHRRLARGRVRLLCHELQDDVRARVGRPPAAGAPT